MLEPHAHTGPATPSIEDDVHAMSRTNVAPQLRTRVVKEARRETWFVVNEGDDDVATLPIEPRSDAALRRVEVNGEAAEFTADSEIVLVRPRHSLRVGAGTIVVLHYR